MWLHLSLLALHCRACFSYPSSQNSSNAIPGSGSFPLTADPATISKPLAGRSHPFLDCGDDEQRFLERFLRTKIANVFRKAARAVSPDEVSSRYNDAIFQEYFGSASESPVNEAYKWVVFDRYRTLALEASLTPFGRLGIYCHGERPPVSQLHSQSFGGGAEPICQGSESTEGDALYVFPEVNEIVLVSLSFAPDQ